MMKMTDENTQKAVNVFFKTLQESDCLEIFLEDPRKFFSECRKARIIQQGEKKAQQKINREEMKKARQRERERKKRTHLLCKIGGEWEKWSGCLDPDFAAAVFENIFSKGKLTVWENWFYGAVPGESN